MARLNYTGAQLDEAISKVRGSYADVSGVDLMAAQARAGKKFVTAAKVLTTGTMPNAVITPNVAVSGGVIGETVSDYPVVITPKATVGTAGYVDSVADGASVTKYIQAETKTATPTTAEQTITPSSGKLLSGVIVEGDSDLAAANIKKNVVIFGVEGTYEASGGGAGISGGYNVTFSSDGSDYAFISIPQGKSINAPIRPTKSSYYFTGWNTAADGTGAKITFPYTPEANITLYAQFTSQVVIGFTGLTNSTNPTPDLVFTDDIASVSKYTTVTDGVNVNVQNALDEVFPFCDIAEITDPDDNVFVKFPRLWLKWVLDGSGKIDGVKFSNVQADEDYFIPDAYLNPADGETYLDYFALGKYEGSGSSSKMYSKSGQACYVNMTRAVARTATRAYGTRENNYNGYQQIDLSMLVIYNFLCMLYYKTPNIQRVYGGRTGSETTGWSGAANTGSCDGITGLNGWDTVTNCVKMLGIENPFGNISKWIDGVYFSTKAIYVHRLPQQYADTTASAVNLGFTRPTETGFIAKLKKGTSDATRSFVYCADAAGGSETKFVGDSCSYGASGVVLSAGGMWGGTSYAGLWYLYGNGAASNANSGVGGRLAYRPV